MHKIFIWADQKAHKHHPMINSKNLIIGTPHKEGFQSMGKSKPVKLKMTASERKAKYYRSATAAVQPDNTSASKTVVYKIYLRICDGGYLAHLAANPAH